MVVSVPEPGSPYITSTLKLVGSKVDGKSKCRVVEYVIASIIEKLNWDADFDA